MQHRYALRQRQPQPCAVLGAGAGFIHHIKGFGYTAELLGRNTASEILDADAVSVALNNAAQYYFSAVFRSLAGVVQ